MRGVGPRQGGLAAHAKHSVRWCGGAGVPLGRWEDGEHEVVAAPGGYQGARCGLRGMPSPALPRGWCRGCRTCGGEGCGGCANIGLAACGLAEDPSRRRRRLSRLGYCDRGCRFGRLKRSRLAACCACAAARWQGAPGCLNGFPASRLRRCHGAFRPGACGRRGACARSRLGRGLAPSHTRARLIVCCFKAPKPAAASSSGNCAHACARELVALVAGVGVGAGAGVGEGLGVCVCLGLVSQVEVSVEVQVYVKV